MIWSIAIFSVLAYQCSALYSSNSPVLSVDERKLNLLLEETELPVFIEFYAPWCGHCKSLVPEYSKAAENGKRLAKFAAIDCDVEKGLCSGYGVKGFPTLKVSYWDKAKQTRKMADYNGQRQASAILDFAVSKLHSYAMNIKSDKVDKFFDLNSLPKAILFTDKENPSALFDALSVHFKDKITFGFVKKSEASLVKEFQVTSFPTILSFKDGTRGSLSKYSGNIERNALFNFFSTKVLSEEPETFTIVHVDSQSKFQSSCLSKNGWCLIAIFSEFNSKEDNEKHVKILEEVGSSSSLEFSLVYMDSGRAAEIMKEFGIGDIFPAAVIINPKKQVFRVLTSFFSQAELTKLVKDSSQSIGRFFSYNKPLRIVELGKDKQEL